MAIDTLGANALASNSVTTAKIVNDAVTSAKIPAGAVVAADVADGSITTAKLADDAVTGGKLANDISISTTGNIATTGSGTITSAGLITASGSVAVGGTGAANTLDDYEEGEFAFTLTDNQGNSDTDNKMRYVKVGQMVFVEGPNRGSAGSNIQQYFVLGGGGAADGLITLTASLPFVPIESGMAVSGIHRNLEKNDGNNANADNGDWLPMIGWAAGSATLYLTDTQSEKSYWAGAGGHTLRKADTRTNVVMSFNFAYRTAS